MITVQFRLIGLCFLVQAFYRAMHYSVVLRLHVVRPSVRPSVCDVDGSGPHTLEILETK